MAFPTTLTSAFDDSAPGAGDGTPIVAAHLNNLEGKIGIDGSVVVTSLDYLLKNAASINPGHKHTPAAGGTGLYAYTVGDLLYASGATALSQLAAVAAGQVLISGGVATAPAWSPSLPLVSALDETVSVSLKNSVNTDGVAFSVADTTGWAYLWAVAAVPLIIGTDDEIRVIIGSTGNLILGDGNAGTDAVRVLALVSGTAPSTAPEDMAQLWVEDVNGAAGYAGFHKMTETTAQKEVIPGVIIKTDTGSPANPYEGLVEINTFDNKIRMYADAGWRQLATW